MDIWITHRDGGKFDAKDPWKLSRVKIFRMKKTNSSHGWKSSAIGRKTASETGKRPVPWIEVQMGRPLLVNSVGLPSRN